MLDGAHIPRLVIAGVQARGGKTAVMVGLTEALRRRDLAVQTFKVGPDLIDCAYLAHASRRPCRSLDGWLLGAEGMLHNFSEGAATADCALIEGSAGLFDRPGHVSPLHNGPTPPLLSTAEIARHVKAPVVMVLDANGMTETAAAIALGVKQLDPALSFAGVIINHVRNEYQAHAIEDALWQMAKVPVLGFLPAGSDIVNKSGWSITPFSEHPEVDAIIAHLGDVIERNCDLTTLERIMSSANPIYVSPRSTTSQAAEPVRCAVAYDEAFFMYYAENLELLEAEGVEIVPFSPLEDKAIPQDIDGLYLGGGLSPAILESLCANRSMMESVRRAHAHGIPIYAECGGLLYCARELRIQGGSTHAMANLIPADIALDTALSKSGYRELQLRSDCLLGSSGTVLRGHEAHAAVILNGQDCLNAAYSMHDSEGQPLGCEGWAADNFLASFVHIHFAQNPELPKNLVQHMTAARHQRHELLLSA